MELAPVTASAAVVAGALDSEGFRGDPVDRVLYATARELRIPFVTKDGRIQQHARDARDVPCVG